MSMPDNLTLAVLSSGGLALVEVVGALDANTASRLEEHMVALADLRTRRVTVDLSQLAFADSEGISVLDAAAIRLRAYGGDMVISAVSPAIRAVLQTTTLDGTTSMT